MPSVVPVHHDEASLRKYFGIAKRRAWVIIFVLVSVSLAALFFTLRQPPLYEASAEVLLNQETLASSLSDIQDPATLQDPNRIAATQTELARVTPLAKRVLEVTGFEERSPAALLAASDVSSKPNADLLVFRVRDRDPDVATRLTTAYAREFTLYRHELNTASLRNARETLSRRISQLLRDGDRRSLLYAQTLIDKEEQLRTMEALESSSAVLLRPAEGASKVQPRPVRNGALGISVGLILGIGLALLIEALDTRVRSVEEIAHSLGLPLLARVPKPSRRLRRNDRLVMLEDPRGVHAEGFRMLRTNLEFANLELGARTIMVTSAVQEEGKSTTIANLAVAFARAGRRVVLVDLDLRRPFLSRFFDLDGVPGLTQVGLGHAELDDALARVAIPEMGGASAPLLVNGRRPVDGVLEILTSGPVPPDAGDFVGTRALRNILQALRERADLILIDVPPLLHVGDAMALAAHMDALILVTRPRALRRPMLGELRRLLAACPTAKLGLIVTGADAEADSGYGYGGAYGYEPREQVRPHRVAL